MKNLMTTAKRKVESWRWVLTIAVLFFASCSSGNSSQRLGAYPKAVTAADEGSAIQTLRTIATAQTQAKATRGSYGDFIMLVQAGFLDQRFASESPIVRGYRFRITAGENDFSVFADPDTTEGKGTATGRHFYLDSTDNSIHQNPAQTASKTDPVL